MKGGPSCKGLDGCAIKHQKLLGHPTMIRGDAMMLCTHFLNHSDFKHGGMFVGRP